MSDYDDKIPYHKGHEAVEWLCSLKDINDAKSYLESITDDVVLFMNEKEAYFTTIVLNEIILKVTEGNEQFNSKAKNAPI